ncbi:hypothetical protein M959_04672, partial [Chaetura pelagica]
TPTTARIRAHPPTPTQCTSPSPKSRLKLAVKGTWASTLCPTKATPQALPGGTCFSTTCLWATYLLALAPPTQGRVVTLVASQPVPLKVKRVARKTPRRVGKTLCSNSQSCSTSVVSSKV